MNIQELINNSIVAKNKAKEQDYKQTSWHASSLGMCKRGLYLKRLGVPPDEELTPITLRKFDVGNIMEDWLVDLIEKSDVPMVERQKRIDWKEMNLSGKADMLLTYENGDKEVFEIKTQHSRSFWWNIKNGNKPHRHHEYQLWCYLKNMGIENGRIIYLSKDDLAIQEYPVKLDDKVLEAEVIALLTELNTAWKAKDPMLLPLPEEDSFQAKYCPCHKHCIDEVFLKTLIGKETYDTTPRKNI